MSIDALVGKKIVGIRINEDYLEFTASDGTQTAFGVYGDCCSHSYFHDFVGADKLLANGPILSAEEIDLEESEVGEGWEVIQCYGFRLITEHPMWGEQTSVFSFRNSSNGYYGGWMEDTRIWPEAITQAVTTGYHSVDELVG
ncbi:hypothetical protein ACFRAQ_34550 [Nocardia sp. NPDC056611]|uniref:DUF7448 domain-containing protein n=1 Tax=Nocardia sp. NPDC056611 TaxID=3345877 RepID=UPI0036735C0A